MKINVLLEKLRGNKVKVIIVSAVVIVAVIGGVSTYFLNCNSEKEITANEEVLSENVEEVKEEETKEIPQDEVVNEDINKTEENVQEQKPKETVQEKPKANTNVSNKPNEQNKIKEQPKKEVKKEEQQVNNNPITYSSKSLGIAFDMPSSWRDKYAIKDDGTTIRVYMKHQDNFNSGIGFLFLITSDINSYSGGQDLDSIGGKKRLNIVGKEYLVGGPLDFRMYENDPLLERFKSMVRQTGQVVSTIRAV